MRIIALSLLVLTAAAGIADAQTARTGGTCSGYAAGCNRQCDTRGARVPECHGSCNNMYAACMQSGTWQGTNVTATGVQRQ